MIYLASQSPRRSQILDQLGIVHEVLLVPAQAGEDEPVLPGEAPADYVRRTALEKARHASDFIDQTRPAKRLALLAADTSVSLGPHILGKPETLADATKMLEMLSGTTHTVHTAVVLAIPVPNEPSWHYLKDESISQVRFKRLSEDEIRTYCESKEPLGKAGAYAIQGRAAAFIEHLEGSYTGVMGLPAFETCRLLSTK